ncbi:hypothetical protein GJ699_00350 [Duganella sp. FT80W]|uniref:HEPN domain-containing protein n=1 Tax=Duganella guangzhouensis TaxID=2666084 RepID=A0A6I2KVN6_9BURK|nr:hypothetical protein [Duganella guangzhouensis]MRW88434.1 hypothetical protein [Duganella guangzhouensis]
MDRAKYVPPPQHAKINQFAIRCFRETGDADYIAARMAMRARLANPFLWSAEQAIEKYLKCILMLNRHSTKNLSHDIGAALALINESLPFKISLNEGEQQVFDHIAQCQGDRYLIHSLSLDDYELLQLDHLVWHLRQYCRPLNVRHYADTPSEKVLLERVREIEAGIGGPAKFGRIEGAFLEKVLEDKKHPAHDALVWQNLMFSLSNRRSVMFRNNWQAINAPLWVNPELADEAAKWMKIPKFALEAAHNWAKQREERKAAQKTG